MHRDRTPINVEIIPGSIFPDLAAAQRAALPFLATDLVTTIRALMAKGLLLQNNGRIIPAHRKDMV